jgi:transcription termination factor Rho
MDEVEKPDVESSADEKPKKTAKRTRTRASTTTRAPRTKRTSRAAAEAPELPLTAAEDSAPAPRPEPAAPAPREEERRAPESEVRSAAPERPAPAPEPAPEVPPSAPESSERRAESDSAVREAGEAPGASPPPRHHDERGESRQDGGAQHGGGGGGDREPWWKRKKDKKKGKWAGKGGGGPERERPPQQPPPPGSAPVHVGDLPNPARFQDFAALDALTAAAAASTTEPISLDKLYALPVGELAARGRAMGAQLEGVPSRRQWLEATFRAAAEQQRPIFDHGWIDLTDDGYGFIVHEHVQYRLYPENSYLPESLIKRYGLKRGHEVEVVIQAPQPGERCPSVVGIRSVMGRDPNTIAAITPFEELVPYYPLSRILMEATEIHRDISMRAVDLLTPIGFGQRGLIVAPPRTGKTVLLQNMANSVSHNFPEAKLILLLIDERPEEVTDFRRHTKGEVVSSTFDESPANHVHAAEMVIEKARRLVELGQHVVILLDSITRLARAYNALASNSGKIMSGGVEATALQKPKRFFGSARNIEGGGSITILGTALIDTGSRMDEVIFEEFKGTGNMELHLDRGLSDKRIFPAINIDRSGTRKEELIYHPDEMQRVYGLRRAMQGIPPVEAMEMFITRLKKTKTNAEFLMSLR